MKPTVEQLSEIIRLIVDMAGNLPLNDINRLEKVHDKLKEFGLSSQEKDTWINDIRNLIRSNENIFDKFGITLRTDLLTGTDDLYYMNTYLF